LSLQSKTNIGCLLILAALATMAWFSFRESQRLADKDRWVSHTRDILELSGELRSHLGIAAGERRTFLQGTAKNLDAFYAASQLARADFDALRKLTEDNPSQQARLDELEPFIRARLTVDKELLESRQLKEGPAQVPPVTDERVAARATQSMNLIREFESAERELLQKRTVDAESSARRAGTINLFLSCSVGLFLLTMMLGLNRELAYRARTDRSVTEQRTLLESILNSCSDAVIVVDRSGKTILSNPAAARLHHGASAAALSEEWPRTFGIYKPDKETLFSLEELPLSRALRGESTDGMEIYVRPSDRDEGRYVLAAGRPLLNQNGDRAGGVVLLRDITDRKQTEEILSVALRESEAIVRERSELSNLADLVHSCQTVEGACKVSGSLLPTIFDYRPGVLYLANASRNLVESAATWNIQSAVVSFDPDSCWALRLGKPYSTADPKTPTRCSHVDAAFTGNYLCVPLVAHGETLGVLYLEDTPNPSVADANGLARDWEALRDRAVVTTDRISLAISNLQLREVLRNQSICDPLTGLFNRRYLEETLEREVHRANRTKRNMSMVMLDLDDFKRFNDDFGHQAGDLLLKEVSSLIKSRVRAGDLACRFGGEEFALVLFETGIDGAYKCIDSLREAVKQLTVVYRKQTLGSVTISAGIASFPVHAANPEDLIRAADEALYRAKKNGRDRIAVCQETDSTMRTVDQML